MLAIFALFLLRVSAVTQIQELKDVVCPRVATISLDDKILVIAGNDSKVEIYAQISSKFMPNQTIITNSSQITAV